jgi:hypothetical protein
MKNYGLSAVLPYARHVRWEMPHLLDWLIGLSSSNIPAVLRQFLSGEPPSNRTQTGEFVSKLSS